jgi:hypothetical protein
MLSSSVPAIFKNAIAEKFHILNNNNVLCIEEKRVKKEEGQCFCEWVKISTEDIEHFCFSIDYEDKDNQDSIFPFFNTNKQTRIKGLRSKNDAIIICQKEQRIYVFLIELKSNMPEKYLQQLELAKLFVDFIIDRFNLVSNGYKIQKENIEYRGVLFSCRNKATSRKKPKFYLHRDKLLSVAEESCHSTYPLQYFLS